MPGRIVKRATYVNEYHELTKKDGAPFVPYAVWKDLFFAAFIILAVAACASLLRSIWADRPGPTRPSSRPRLSRITFSCGSMLCFLCSRRRLRRQHFSSARSSSFVGLLLLPFLSGEGEKSWKRRPIAVLTVLLIAITLGTFTHLAEFTPWSPHMNAWSGDPVPDRYLHGTTALERQGALVFQAKQCRNCHALGESGGQRGPALDSVAVRLTQDQLIRQVIQGGGNMPAYGKNLSPAETTALVAFLETLHPPGQAPARDASRELVARRWRTESSCRATLGERFHATSPSRCSRDRPGLVLVTRLLILYGLVYLRGWCLFVPILGTSFHGLARRQFSDRIVLDLDCSGLSPLPQSIMNG